MSISLFGFCEWVFSVMFMGVLGCVVVMFWVWV